MHDTLIILGAGDLAREIKVIAASNGAGLPAYEAVAFVDDNPALKGTQQAGLDIIGWAEVAARVRPDTAFIVGVGRPRSREAMLQRLASVAPDARFATVVHRSAVLVGENHIGDGVYIGPNVTLALGVQVHDHAMVNHNASIGHDCVIGTMSAICPGCILSGRTQIGAVTFLGSGAITYPGARIGSRCTVSASAVIQRTLADGEKAIVETTPRVFPPKR